MPLHVDRLDEALWVAENGQKIFIEAGMYTVSQGGSSHYVYGKNVSMVGASTKDCALLYQNTESAAPAPASPNLETFLICAGSGEVTLVKRLSFRNANFFGIGHVQIEVSKYFVIGDDIIIFTLTMLRVRSACFDSVVSGEVDVV